MPLAGASAPSAYPAPTAFGSSRFDIVEAEYWHWIEASAPYPTGMSFNDAFAIIFHNMSVAGTGANWWNCSVSTHRWRARRHASAPLPVDNGAGQLDYGIVTWPGYASAHSVHTQDGANLILFLPWYDSIGGGGSLGTATRSKYGLRCVVNRPFDGAMLFDNMQPGVDRNTNPHLKPDQMAANNTFDLTGYVCTHRWYLADPVTFADPVTGYGTRVAIDGTTLVPVATMDAGTYAVWRREFRCWPRTRPHQVSEWVWDFYFPDGYASRLRETQLLHWLLERFHGAPPSPAWATFKGTLKHWIGGVRYRSATDGWLDAMAVPWTYSGGDPGADVVGWGFSPRQLRFRGGTRPAVLIGHTGVDEFVPFTTVGNPLATTTTSFDWDDAPTQSVALEVEPAILPVSLVAPTPRPRFGVAA